MRNSVQQVSFVFSIPKSELAHETVAATSYVSYYFHPMKVSALKIREARGGPRREMSIEA